MCTCECESALPPSIYAEERMKVVVTRGNVIEIFERECTEWKGTSLLFAERKKVIVPAHSRSLFERKVFEQRTR
jgi:hypothetical protein